MSDGIIRIMCPRLTCRKVLAVPVGSRGKVVRCKSCGTNIRIPAKKTAATKDNQQPAEHTDQDTQSGQAEQAA